METKNNGAGERVGPELSAGSPPSHIPTPPPPPVARVLPLYSQLSVTIISFLGGGFALGYLLSRNMRRLGYTNAANNYLLGGVFGAFLCALFLASLKLADFIELRYYYFLIQSLWAIAAYYLFKIASGKEVEEKVASGKTRYARLPGQAGTSVAFFLMNLFVIFFLGIYISY